MNRDLPKRNPILFFGLVIFSMILVFGPTGSSIEMFLPTVHSTPACGSFTSVPDVSVGGVPISVAVGDFNNDGNKDLATANQGVIDSVSIRFGDGSGGFSGGSNVSVGHYPNGVAVGDFNNDGKLDFASTNHIANTVSVRLGDGGGGFSVAADVGVGAEPHGIAIGDFNNDGNQDIATGNANLTASVRVGDGSGGFGGGSDVSVGSLSFSIALADFNNDGNLDFVTGNAGSLGGASVRLGDGLGGFSNTTEVDVGGLPRSVAVGDFNGDGNQDLAAPIYDTSVMAIRLGDGTGGFANASDVPVSGNPVSVAVGDLDNDGDLDFAVSNTNQHNVSIRLGDGFGGFSGTTDESVSSWPYELAMGDLNNDGSLDFVAGRLISSVAIRLGQCPNSSPTSNAGGLYTGTEGSPISMSAATATDANPGDVLTYSWTVNSASCVFDNPVVLTPTLTCGNSGSYTATLSVSDGVNPPVSSSAAVSVIYNFNGFFQPVDNLPVVNVANAGQSIPLKFSLNGNKGLNIFAAGSPSSAHVPCGTSVTSDVEESVTAGGSSLSYDASTDQYSYVWKTDKSWKATCRLLMVRLNDGSTHMASFRFK